MEAIKAHVRRPLALFLALTLLLSACGKNTTAATMHLVKTEGSVNVADAGGKAVKLLDNLGLYSGYGVGTQAVSYAWMSLDDTKLAKMDENSEIEIEKDGKLLEVFVRSGSMYFDVTKPLEDDETMNIRTSTMVVGIRGTEGWVQADSDDILNAYLLKGQVECTVYDGDGGVLGSETISAGETARMESSGEIKVSEFTELPGFVASELDYEWEAPDASGFVPWSQAGLTDHVMDWGDTGLESAMMQITGITDRDIMLSDVWELQSLDLHLKNIYSIDALGELTNLTVLQMNNNYISDITALSGLYNLTSLDLDFNGVTDIAPLMGLTRLEVLSLWSSRVEDLTPLAGLTNLTCLQIGGNLVADVTPLAGLVNLQELRLERSQITSITPLAGLTALEYLELPQNQIADCSPLAGLTELTYLDVSSNQISDCSPLAGLVNLTYLDMSYNQISDVAPLSGLTELTELKLNGNRITDASPVEGLPKLKNLTLSGNPIGE